jgi:hypothetical protein
MNNRPSAKPTEDEPRTCVDGGDPFILRAGAWQWLERKGLHKPKRCAACRARRHREREREQEQGTRPGR